MYRLTAKIEITGAKSWLIDKVTEVEITRDTEKLTDECRLTLPKKSSGTVLRKSPYSAVMQ